MVSILGLNGKRLLSLFLLLVIFLLLAGVLVAQEGKGGRMLKSQMKEISGEVSAITKNIIAIIYKRDLEKGTEEEMLLPIDKDIALEGKKSLDQIKVGDTVYVRYEESKEEGEAGRINTRLKAKLIGFIRPKPIEPPLKDLSEEEGVMVSE